MTFQDFVVQNIWGILMAAGGLLATVITVRVSLQQLLADVKEMQMTLGLHGDRLHDLEVAQAHRLGYEKALAELNGKTIPPHQR